MPQWIRLLKDDGTPIHVADLPEGDGTEVMAGDQVIALFHVNGQFHALDGVCPHSGGPLGMGAVQGTTVTCPWHGWQFDVTTGRNCLNSRVTHTCFQVKVEGDGLFVEIP